MMKEAKDEVFLLAKMQDPFINQHASYLNALSSLPLGQRRLIARQVAILAAVLSLDTLDCLELLGQVGIHLHFREVARR